MSSLPRPITELAIGGAAYRVQSSANEEELRRLAAMVDARLAHLPEGRRHESRSLVLVALELAHDLEAERTAHAQLRAQIAKRLTSLIDRVDVALDHHDEHGDPLPPVPQLRADAPPTQATEDSEPGGHRGPRVPSEPPHSTTGAAASSQPAVVVPSDGATTEGAAARRGHESPLSVRHRRE